MLLDHVTWSCYLIMLLDRYCTDQFHLRIDSTYRSNPLSICQFNWQANASINILGPGPSGASRASRWSGLHLVPGIVSGLPLVPSPCIQRPFSSIQLPFFGFQPPFSEVWYPISDFGSPFSGFPYLVSWCCRFFNGFVIDVGPMLGRFFMYLSYLLHRFFMTDFWMFFKDAPKNLGSLLFRRTLADTYSTAWT